MLLNLLKLIEFGVIVQNDELHNIIDCFSSVVFPFKRRRSYGKLCEYGFKLCEFTVTENPTRVTWNRRCQGPRFAAEKKSHLEAAKKLIGELWRAINPKLINAIARARNPLDLAIYSIGTSHGRHITLIYPVYKLLRI